MAKLIKTNGEASIVHPENGIDFTLEELQKYVGGLIDMIYFDRVNQIMIINDEGKIDGLECNVSATDYYQLYFSTNDYIAGDVLLCSESEIS